MRKKILVIGFAIALCIAIVIPISAQATEEFSATATATTPAAEALEGIIIRVNIAEFTYTMPSVIRPPGPLSDQWYITGTVKNEEGKIIAEKRSGIYHIGESGRLLDLVIWKDIPERGDKVTITLGARTYALGYYIDINPEEIFLRKPHDPTGRRHTTDYVVGTEQEGWGIGRKLVLADLDGKLHYKIETIGLPEPEPPESPKGCIIEYFPHNKKIEEGTVIEMSCIAMNCGGLDGAIESRIFDADTGEILASYWKNCDRGNKSCMVVAKEDIIINRNLFLGFQASHWDHEHGDWMRDETRYAVIMPKPTPTPTPTATPTSTPTPVPVIFTTVVTPTPTPTPPPTVTPTAISTSISPIPTLTHTPTPTPIKRSLAEIFAGWLDWLRGLFSS